jgi:hypothetical protein
MLLPADFWSAERQYLAAVIRPHLATMATLGVATAETRLGALNIFFDNALAHAEAARWARQYTDTLLEQLGSTSERLIGEKVASYIETPQATIGELVSQLKPVLDGNAIRAWRIASTETTRAFVSGSNAAYRQAGLPVADYAPPGHPHCRCDTAVKRVGDQWVIVWLTHRDELVCTRPIQTPWGEVAGCRGLHGIIISRAPWFGQKIGSVGRA